MDKSDFAKEFMPTFLDELHEHVESINRELLALEKDPPADERQQTLRLLFRAAHSLKGAARAMSVEVIEVACHLMEDILSEVREGKTSLTPELFALFFRIADALEEAGMRLREDQDLTDAPLSALIPELEQAAARRSAAGDSQQELATSGEPESRAENTPALRRAQPAAETREAESLEAESLEAEAQTSDAARAASPPAASNPVSTDAGTPAGEETPTTATPIEVEQPTAVSASASIRVAAEKLDAMLAQSGELLVARRRVEQRTDDALSHSDSLAELLAKWQELEQPLQDMISRQQSFSSDPNVFWSDDEAVELQQIGTQLAQAHKDAERLAARMLADARILDHTCDVLDDEIHRVRMLPFAEACGGLQRAVRDIARTTGKDVQLSIEGEDVEIDRSVLEGLKDPLLHLVRNSVDHGIEPPEEREKAGKTPQAHVIVSAALRGGYVQVTVADDGRGFDLDRIREKLRKKKLAVPQDGRELARMVFLPGFSTAEFVTDVSGRGVGLDVVESRIQSLHGAVDIDFETGVGTRFFMTVPLTLTTIRSVFADAGGLTYAIPTSNVQQIVRFERDSVRSVHGRDVLILNGKPTSLAGLADVLQQGNRQPAYPMDKLLAVVLRAGDQSVALLVDEVRAEQEILVKNLGARIRRARLVSGTTLLASGNIALVLNANNLVRKAVGQATGGAGFQQSTDASSAPTRRLLVVDDSMTTRALMKNILETAGYEVTSAADGQQGWEMLANHQFDLVVSDVDMPRMNGFELTSAIRGSGRFDDLPIVLVTARNSDADKSCGVKAGANAYLVKSSFDQSNLLETIEQLL